MTLNIELNPDLEAKLRSRAAAAGKDPEAFALEAVAEKLSRQETFDEILAPLRREVRESGMSETELNSLLESALAESRRERKLSDETAAHFLAQAVSCAEALPEPPKAFSLPRDPDDEPYLNLAIAGGAEYLVTWNERHLNYLMRRDTPEGKEFCARHPDLKIVTPPEFLEEVRRKLATEKGDSQRE